jgi:uncharacterized protein
MRMTPNRTLRNVDRQFWDYCGQEEMRLQRCSGCHTYKWPPVNQCDDCATAALEWERLSGNGALLSSCLYERQYFDQCPPPWPVILVELDEGPLFLGNPYQFDSEMSVAGTRVKVRFIDASDDDGLYRLPVFVPEASQ